MRNEESRRRYMRGHTGGMLGLCHLADDEERDLDSLANNQVAQRIHMNGQVRGSNDGNGWELQLEGGEYKRKRLQETFE